MERLIETKELMIGDYLKLGTLPWRVAQVTNPKMDDELWSGFTLENGVEDEGEPIPLTPKIMEPIPLTPKIMESIGFNHVKVTQDGTTFHNYCWSSEQRTDLISVYFYENKTDLRVFGTGSHFSLSRGTIYLHELQHAIINCGIDLQFEIKIDDVR